MALAKILILATIWIVALFFFMIVAGTIALIAWMILPESRVYIINGRNLLLQTNPLRKTP